MNPGKPRSLPQLLAGHGRLGKLAQEAAARVALSRRVRERLPPTLADHVVHVSPGQAGTAVVTVDSAAWASRLHYDQQTLIEALRAEGVMVRRLALKVSPP